MVCSITASSSAVSVSRSTCWRSRALKAAIVWAVSWRRRLKRRSTACWMRRRAGWNTAATARGPRPPPPPPGLGGARPHQGGISAQQLAQPEDHDRIPTAQQQGQQAVGEGPADDAVQVVQPIAQDRRPDACRQDRRIETAHQRRQGIGAQRQRGQVDHGQHGDQHRGQRQPAQLLALDATGAAEAAYQRDPAAPTKATMMTAKAAW
jgi:hypothetical protein